VKFRGGSREKKLSGQKTREESRAGVINLWRSQKVRYTKGRRSTKIIDKHLSYSGKTRTAKPVRLGIIGEKEKGGSQQSWGAQFGIEDG